MVRIGIPFHYFFNILSDRNACNKKVTARVTIIIKKMKIFYWPWEGWSDGSWNPTKPDTFKECFLINQTYWFFLGLIWVYNLVFESAKLWKFEILFSISMLKMLALYYVFLCSCRIVGWLITKLSKNYY